MTAAAEDDMRDRWHERGGAVAVRLLCAALLALTLAACDKCGDVIFGPQKSQACKGEAAPR